jgi:hypothetical protein
LPPTLLLLRKYQSATMLLSKSDLPKCLVVALCLVGNLKTAWRLNHFPTLVDTNWVDATSETSVWRKTNAIRNGKAIATAKATRINESKIKKTKYIKYAATQGWANQLKSLEHALWIAHATERTLILPPAQYHKDTIQWTFLGYSMNEVYGNLVRSHEQSEAEAAASASARLFNQNISANNNFKPFRKNDGSKPRAPLTRILDFAHEQWNWTTVPVLDYVEYLDLLQRLHDDDSTGSRKCLTERHMTMDLGKDPNTENGFFNCLNTRFTFDHSKHLQVETNITCYDHHGLPKNNNLPRTFTYQHIATALQPYEEDYDVWSWNFIYPESLFDTVSIPAEAQLQIHYTQPLQQAAHLLKQSWPGQHYAAIHVRAGDGPFKKQDWNRVFSTSMKMIEESILQYHEKQESLQPSSWTDYTLLVISDSRSLLKRSLLNDEDNATAFASMTDKNEILQKWLVHETKLKAALQNHRIRIHVRTRLDYRGGLVTQLQQDLQSQEADVYLDQLLAACADLGFGYYKSESTYQARIVSMRKQSISPCHFQ